MNTYDKRLIWFRDSVLLPAPIFMTVAPPGPWAEHVQRVLAVAAFLSQYIGMGSMRESALGSERAITASELSGAISNPHHPQRTGSAVI